MENEPTPSQSPTNPNILKTKKLIHQKVTRSNTPSTPILGTTSMRPDKREKINPNLPYISQDEYETNPELINEPKYDIAPHLLNPQVSKDNHLPVITQDEELPPLPKPRRSA